MKSDDLFQDLDALERNYIELCRRFESLFEQVESPVEPLWNLVEEKKRGKEKAPSDFQGPFLPEAFLGEWTERLAAKIEAARHYLPLVYQDDYVKPLLRNLGRVVRSNDDVVEAHNIAETLAGAVVQHMPGSPVRHPVRQFLAVVSNLYRSFLSPDKRVSAEVPLATPALPPLVVFHHGRTSVPYGPAVFTAPMTRLLCGSDVAVVVMPATYHRTPLAWVPLAHEASGHGVLQADPDLLPDVIDGVRALFGGGPLPPGQKPDKNQALGLLWSYWAEETASDVYGLLNVGPAFALNLAAFLAAQRSFAAKAAAVKVGSTGPAPPSPMLEVQFGTDCRMDLGAHPVDLLRLHVAIGVIENLVGLSSSTIRAYTRALRRIADLCGRKAWETRKPEGKILIKGRVEVERERWVPLELELSIKAAAESARRVGAFIASTRLGALGNRTIQDLETWDDADELAARSICEALSEPSLVRRKERVGGKVKEVRLTVHEALRELELPDGRVDQVITALLTDQFQVLTDEELEELNLGNLTPELREALKAERIDDLLGDDALVRAVDLDRIEALGDDGQLLAGATLAALCDPSEVSYRWINRRLAYALNRSYHHDEKLGFAALHRMLDEQDVSPSFASLPPHEPDHDALEQAADVGVAAKPASGRAKAPPAAGGASPEKKGPAKAPGRKKASAKARR